MTEANDKTQKENNDNERGEMPNWRKHHRHCVFTSCKDCPDDYYEECVDLIEK